MPRLVRVSLQDVPIELRRQAAAPLIRRCKEDGGIGNVTAAIALEKAVTRPSATVYRLPADAVERVLGTTVS